MFPFFKNVIAKIIKEARKNNFLAKKSFKDDSYDKSKEREEFLVLLESFNGFEDESDVDFLIKLCGRHYCSGYIFRPRGLIVLDPELENGSMYYDEGDLEYHIDYVSYIRDNNKKAGMDSLIEFRNFMLSKHKIIKCEEPQAYATSKLEGMSWGMMNLH